MKNTINIGEKYKINGHEYEIIKVTDTHVITYVEILSPKLLYVYTPNQRRWRMSKAIRMKEISELLASMTEASNKGELEQWLKSRVLEPEVGEICEFSDDESFPDSETYVGYFAGKTAKGFLASNKRLGVCPYTYARSIKGGR
jgi:hypothetical protein